MTTAARVLIVVVLGGLLIVEPAQAHAQYLRSEPGDGATVAEAPAHVDIWFTQDMFRRQSENWIHVTGPNGEQVQSGDAKIDDDDRRHLSVQLMPNLAPGAYQVDWRNLSAEDAHENVGSFTFRVDPDASVTSTPMGQETPTHRPPSATNTPAVGTAEASPTTETSSRAGPCGAASIASFGLIALFAARRTRRASRP